MRVGKSHHVSQAEYCSRGTQGRQRRGDYRVTLRQHAASDKCQQHRLRLRRPAVVRTFFEVVCGLIVAMQKGGFCCCQHLVLRTLLWRCNLGPITYVRFLNFALSGFSCTSLAVVHLCLLAATEIFRCTQCLSHGRWRKCSCSQASGKRTLQFIL